jgi:hypothetical protein
MATTVVTPDPAIQGPALLRLRPRDVPGLFDQAVWLYRRNFRVFLGIAALIYLPVTVLISLATSWLLDPTELINTLAPRGGDEGTQQATVTALSDFFSRISLISTISIVSSVLLAVAEGALARAIADRYLGRPVTVRGTYRAIRPSIIWLIVFVFVQSVAAYLLILPPLGIYVYIALSFVPQVIVLEQTNIVTAIQRSWRLVQNQWWRTLGMNVLVLLIAAIIVLPALVAGEALGFAGQPWAISNFATQFFTQGLSLIYLPARLAALTLMYYDLRIRKEGYDLEVAVGERRASLAALTPAPAPPTNGVAPLADSGAALPSPLSPLPLRERGTPPVEPGPAPSMVPRSEGEGWGEDAGSPRPEPLVLPRPEGEGWGEGERPQEPPLPISEIAARLAPPPAPPETNGPTQLPGRVSPRAAPGEQQEEA